MEISAYSLVQAHVCSKPLSVFVASPAGNWAPVAGSYHLISNGPARPPCSRTVLGESGLPFTCATMTTSDFPPRDHRCSSFTTPSTATLNGDAASAGNMLAVMERAKRLFTVHTAPAAFVSAGCAQTISTAVPLAASIAFKNGEVPDSDLRMRGLFSACSPIHAASCRQPSE